MEGGEEAWGREEAVAMAVGWLWVGVWTVGGVLECFGTAEVVEVVAVALEVGGLEDGVDGVFGAGCLLWGYGVGRGV